MVLTERVENHRRHIPVEQPIQGGPIKLNYKLLWAAGFVVLGFVLLFVCLAANQPWLGAILVLAMGGLFAAIIQFEPFDNWRASLMTIMVRRGTSHYRKWLGVQRQQLKQPLDGELFRLEPKPSVTTTSSSRRRKRSKPPGSPPPAYDLFGDIRFIAHPVDSVAGQKYLGIVHDVPNDTMSAALQLHCVPLGSAADDLQVRWMRGFATILDTVAGAGSNIYRISFRLQTLTGEALDTDSLTSAVQAGAQLPREPGPNFEVLQRRLPEMAALSVQHVVTLVLSVYLPDIARAAKLAGGPEAVLLEQLGHVYSVLQGDGVSPVGMQFGEFLSYDRLVLLNRLGLDPIGSQGVWEGYHGPPPGYSKFHQDAAWPGTIDFDTSPEWCRLGQTYHQGCYIGEFSPVGVVPEQFQRLLELKVPKTVTMALQMVPPRESVKRAQWASRAVAHYNLERAAHNKTVSAAEQVRQRRAEQHEEKIAEEGHGQEVRARCWIDAHGSSIDEVQTTIATIRAAADRSQFRLEMLAWRQLLGIEAAMPVARGLRAIRLPRWAQ